MLIYKMTFIPTGMSTPMVIPTNSYSPLSGGGFKLNSLLPTQSRADRMMNTRAGPSHTTTMGRLAQGAYAGTSGANLIKAVSKKGRKKRGRKNRG